MATAPVARLFISPVKVDTGALRHSNSGLRKHGGRGNRNMIAELNGPLGSHFGTEDRIKTGTQLSVPKTCPGA
jgi:hypothetical protein